MFLKIHCAIITPMESLKLFTNRSDTERSKKIKDILLKLSARRSYEYMDEIVEFSKILEKKYPDTKKHIIFHDLIGSGMVSTDEVVYEDFPGNDSVEKFVANLAKKYLPIS